MIVNDCHHDTTAHVFEKMLDGGTTREYILEDDECPLHILHQRDRGAVTFHIKRRAGDTGGQRGPQQQGAAGAAQRDRGGQRGGAQGRPAARPPAQAPHRGHRHCDPLPPRRGEAVSLDYLAKLSCFTMNCYCQVVVNNLSRRQHHTAPACPALTTWSPRGCGAPQPAT